MGYWTLFVTTSTFAVGTAFPAYCSVEALESKSAIDDSQWLTYWVIAAFISIFERFAVRALPYFPLYAECKLLLLVWLALPPFNGAAFLFKLARPNLVKGVTHVKKNVAQIMAADPSQFDVDGAYTQRRERTAEMSRSVHDFFSRISESIAKGASKSSLFDEKERALRKAISGEGSDKTGFFQQPGAEYGDSAHEGTSDYDSATKSVLPPQHYD